MPRSPLLQPPHFASTPCLLTEHGLEYESEINDLRLAANPRRPSAETLKKRMREAQNSCIPSNERINVGYCFPKRYDRRWTSDDEEEGQHLILVAYRGSSVAGFANIDTKLIHEDNHLCAHFSVHMLYVVPQHRGQGMGNAIADGIGEICESILYAAYAAAPPGTTIDPVLYADYHSHGGEKLAERICSYLSDSIGILFSENANTANVAIEDITLDAGW